MSRYDLEPEPDDLRNEAIRIHEKEIRDTREHPPKTGDLEHETRYNLRDSELQTLVDLGTFRIIRRDDLTIYGYAGDDDQANRDLTHLTDQGLIQQRISYPERELYLTLAAMDTSTFRTIGQQTSPRGRFSIAAFSSVVRPNTTPRSIAFIDAKPSRSATPEAASRALYSTLNSSNP